MIKLIAVNYKLKNAYNLSHNLRFKVKSDLYWNARKPHPSVARTCPLWVGMRATLQ
jgi:hypothetical protein